MVVWITGLSGAGKTHIGRALYNDLKNKNRATVLIDGDEVRALFRQDQDDEAYSLAGRRRNAERIRQLCAWLDSQEIDVVCCILSIFEESHVWNRAHFQNYLEVYISAPMEVLIERNPRDLYRRAMRGEIKNVVGVDIPYLPPTYPDLVIENGSEFVDTRNAVQLILDAIKEKLSG